MHIQNYIRRKTWAGHMYSPSLRVMHCSTHRHWIIIFLLWNETLLMHNIVAIVCHTTYSLIVLCRTLVCRYHNAVSFIAANQVSVNQILNNIVSSLRCSIFWGTVFKLKGCSILLWLISSVSNSSQNNHQKTHLDFLLVSHPSSSLLWLHLNWHDSFRFNTIISSNCITTSCFTFCHHCGIASFTNRLVIDDALIMVGYHRVDLAGASSTNTSQPFNTIYNQAWKMATNGQRGMSFKFRNIHLQSHAPWPHQLHIWSQIC